MITKNTAGGTLSAGFISKLQSTANNPRIRFVHNGTSYDEYVISVSQIHRNGTLSTGTTIVKLSNADQSWNNFVDTVATELGKTASVSLYFEGDTEYMPLVTGIVNRVVYNDPNITIYISDRFATMLEFPLGSGQSPKDYYTAGPYNTADLIWDILTTMGGLDSTASSANTDIDYDKWLLLKNALASSSVKARFTGHSIQSALRSIAAQYDADIWVDNAGKFNFMISNMVLVFNTMSTSDFISLDLEVTKEGMINDYSVYFDFDIANDAFLSTPYTLENASSIAAYGRKAVTVEDRTCWHTTSESARQAVSYAGNYGLPRKWFIVTAPFYHLRAQIGDYIRITEAHKGISAEAALIKEITIDLNRGITIIKAVN